jgi:hypothetical protein
VWTMEEFTPSEAAVHTAIGRRHTRENWQSALPTYVPRDYDQALHADVRAATSGQLRALILLRGTSSTGKTRSLFEAIRTVCPEHVVLRPRTVEALLKLPDADLLDRPAVIWLNELQGFLGPPGAGLSREFLRDLFAHADTSPVVVGTIWPEKMRSLTGGHDDRSSESRELLMQCNQWVRWYDVPPTLSARERAAARELSRSDPRVAAALKDRDRVGFAQTLAGAHELLNHYNVGSRLARMVLEAAADVRRLGVSQAMSPSLLEAMTVALWRAEHGAVSLPVDGLDAALAYVTAPIRSEDGVRSLIPLDEIDSGEFCGYSLADYLEQHLGRRRATCPITDGEWAALVRHIDEADDLLTLAREAEGRGRLHHAEALFRASGPTGLGRLAMWLCARPGREQEAEAALVDAAAAGSLEVLPTFREWFRKRGRGHEAEDILRKAGDSGSPNALRNLAAWFGQTRGEEHRAEPVIRRATGDTYLLLEYADWLRVQPGREHEAEAAYRKAAANGDSWAPYALSDVAQLLSELPGRENDTITAYRAAAAAGYRDALPALANWLSTQPGREQEVEATCREVETAYREEAVQNPRAFRDLASWLLTRPGREAEAEAAYRDAAANGDREALSYLASWLCRKEGREQEGEAVYREDAAGGDPRALCRLADWLRTRPGRERDAEAAYREAGVDGLLALAAWLRRIPGREQDTEAVYREAADRDTAANGNRHALGTLVKWLETQPGREHDVEAAYRDAAAAGNRDALSDLAQWLSKQPGREHDAEIAYREAVVAGCPLALSHLTEWLRSQPKRESELRTLERHGVDAFGATACD